MRRYAERNGRQTGGNEAAERAFRTEWKNEGERTGPVMLRKFADFIVKPSDALRTGEIRHVND
jgi:hypothetical protein